MTSRRPAGFVSLVLALLAVCVTGSLLASRWRLDHAVATFVARSRVAGIQITLGQSRSALFGRSYDVSRFTFSHAPKLQGMSRRIEFSARPWEPCRVAVSGVSLDAEGEPFELLRVAKSTLERFPKEVTIAPVDLRYRHPILGELKLDSLALETQDPDWVVSIGTARLGARIYRNAVIGIFERQDFFVFSLGARTLKDARFQLTQYGSPRRGSIWNLQLAHQGLAEVLAALDWKGISGIENTKVVGQLTLVDSPDHNVRGSLQLTFDDFPQPPIPEPEAMFGHSASLFFRLLRKGTEGFDFDAPYVEANSSLFTLKGGGRVTLFGDRSSLLFDVSGRSLCTVLASQLAPSRYRSQAESRPREAPLGTNLPLRVQLQVSSRTASPDAFALAFEGGCGIEPRSIGTFQSLDLPSNQPSPFQASPQVP
ncbi:MAG: hypothetical protein QM784_13155 [Polyangiaceae bacterium]